MKYVSKRHKDLVSPKYGVELMDNEIENKYSLILRNRQNLLFRRMYEDAKKNNYLKRWKE